MTVRSGNEAIIEEAVRFYVKSVVNADVNLANSIWQDSPKTTMIHPRGEDFGWDSIRQHFYIDRLQKLYAERNFTIENLDIQTYSKHAVVTFSWHLTGKLRSDGTEVEHHGRSSQIYRHRSTGRWEIIHAHVSGMPIESERQSV